MLIFLGGVQAKALELLEQRNTQKQQASVMNVKQQKRTKIPT